MAVIVKLAEYVVPNLDIAVALAAYGTSGFSAAELLASVIVDLRAGAAGAGAVLPEVVLFFQKRKIRSAGIPISLFQISKASSSST